MACLITFLIGCAERITTELILEPIPPIYLSCADAPQAPDPEIGYTTRDIGEYIARLNYAYQDCKSTIADLKEWYQSIQDIYGESNEDPPLNAS